MPQTAQLRRRLVRTKFRALPDVGEGAFQATVSVYGVTYDVFDLWFESKEQLAPGTFTDSIETNAQLPIFWMHGWDSSPIGDALASEEGNNVNVKGQFYVDDPKALSVYRANAAGAIREWSIGFYALAVEQIKEPASDPRGDDVDLVTRGELIEASSVVRGANPETETIEVLKRMRKEGALGDFPVDQLAEQLVRRLRSRGAVQLRGAIPPHKTDTDDGAWDSAAMEKNLSNDDGEAEYKQAYAWQDPNGNPDKKNAYKFLHHDVTSSGVVGAANTIACTSGIASLNGARGGSTIPDADVQGVWEHLAGHLKDAGQDAPELQSRNAPAPRADLSPVELRRLFAYLRRGVISEEEAITTLCQQAPRAV